LSTSTGGKPLQQLTKKGDTWRWTKDEQKTFKELKQPITLTPILVQPDQDVHFQLEMDTSGYAMGAVLSQLCKDNKWHPIGLMSKSISDAERTTKP